MNLFHLIYQRQLHPDLTLFVTIQDAGEGDISQCKRTNVLHVHKCFLALNSDYFSRLLSHLDKNISDVTVSIFQDEYILFQAYILPFLYSNQTSVYFQDDDWISLLPSSLQVENLLAILLHSSRKDILLNSSNVSNPNESDAHLSLERVSSNTFTDQGTRDININNQHTLNGISKSISSTGVNSTNNDNMNHNPIQVKPLHRPDSNLSTHSRIKLPKEASILEYPFQVSEYLSTVLQYFKFVHLYSLAEFFSIPILLKQLQRIIISERVALCFAIFCCHDKFLSKGIPMTLLQNLIDILGEKFVRISPEEFSLISKESIFLQILEKRISLSSQTKQQASKEFEFSMHDSFTSDVVFHWLQVHSCNDIKKFQKFIIPNERNALFLHSQGIDCTEIICQFIASPSFSFESLHKLSIDMLVGLLSQKSLSATEDFILHIVLEVIDHNRDSLDETTIETLIGTVQIEFIGNESWEMLLQKDYLHGDFVKRLMNCWVTFKNNNPNIDTTISRYMRNSIPTFFAGHQKQESLSKNFAQSLQDISMEQRIFNSSNKSLEDLNSKRTFINTSSQISNVANENSVNISMSPVSQGEYRHDQELGEKRTLSRQEIFEPQYSQLYTESPLANKTSKVISDFYATLPNFIDKTWNMHHESISGGGGGGDIFQVFGPPHGPKPQILQDAEDEEVPTFQNSSTQQTNMDNQPSEKDIVTTVNKKKSKGEMEKELQARNIPSIVDIGQGKIRIGRLLLAYENSKVCLMGFVMHLRNTKSGPTVRFCIDFDNITASYKCTIAQILVLSSKQSISIGMKNYIPNIDFIVISMENVSARRFREVVKVFDISSPVKAKETSTLSLNKIMKNASKRRQCILKSMTKKNHKKEVI